MSSKIDHGGFAFPHQFEDVTGNKNWMQSQGMSLRDWFAGQMLPRIGTGWPNMENRELLARQAYQMADAMIAFRNPAPDPARIKRASELTDEEISTELFQLGKQVSLGFEEHGGSPGEWIYERRDELSAEQDRRAARKAGA